MAHACVGRQQSQASRPALLVPWTLLRTRLLLALCPIHNQHHLRMLHDDIDFEEFTQHEYARHLVLPRAPMPMQADTWNLG